MAKKRLLSVFGTGLALVMAASGASAAGLSEAVLKVGVLTDMSGVYSDLCGPGSVAAAQMAIDEFGGKVLGKKIELVSADHQNKADIAANKAREWFDTGKVDVIADLPNSSAALAVMEVAKQKQDHPGFHRSFDQDYQQ